MKKTINYTIKVTILSFCFICFTFISKAQDAHFTMYDAMPSVLNPAASGVFDGDVRAVLHYRNQWASISNPFKTYSFSIDGGLFKNNWRNGYLGVGLNAFKDVAGTSNLGTSKINLALSSVLFLDDKNSASIGFVGSWAQNSINPENLQWSSQFNGQTYDPSLSSNENFSFESTHYFDFSAGGLWAYGKGAKTLSSKDQLKIQAGFTFFHVSRPDQKINFGNADKLYSKWAFHTESFIGLSNTRLAIKPKLLILLQGPSKEMIFGSMFRYLLQEKSKYTNTFKGMAIAFGGYYRIGDAISPTIELEIAHFAFGMSYDINTSGLTKASGGSGGFEVYIRFQNPNPFNNRSSSAARFN